MVQFQLKEIKISWIANEWFTNSYKYSSRITSPVAELLVRGQLGHLSLQIQAAAGQQVQLM